MDAKTENTIRLICFTVGLVIAAGVLLAAVVVAVDVFLLVFLGILFAVLLCKVSHLLTGWLGIAYGWALGIVGASLLGLCVGFFYLFGVQIAQQIDRAEQRIGEAIDDFRSELAERPRIKAMFQSLPYAGEMFREAYSEVRDRKRPFERQRARTPSGDEGDSSDNNQNKKNQQDDSSQSSNMMQQQAQAAAGKVAGIVGRMFATTFGFFTNTALILFVGIFVAADPGLYQQGVIRLFPKEKRERVQNILNELGDTLWHWMLGRGIAMIITGAGTGISLWLLGVPLAFTLGSITAVLTFIPNIGAIISLALAVLVALSVSPMTAVWVVVIYLVLQLVESNIITPLVQQRQVSMPPALLLACQLLMAALTGFLGVMVATPLLAGAMVVVKRAYIEDVLDDEIA